MFENTLKTFSAPLYIFKPTRLADFTNLVKLEAKTKSDASPFK